MKPIFLVDDSPTILLSMTTILTKAGYAVEKAASGEEALAKVQAGLSFCLMITDYNMPGINGVQLIQELRRVSALRFAPMLMLTTESEQEKRDQAKSAGATGWLVKPVTAEKLLQVIAQVAPSALATA